MDGQKANLVLTDPPYNVNVEETAGKIKNDNMPDEDFYKFLFAAFVNMEQSMEQDASIYVFHADTEGLNFRKAFKDAGFYLSGCCIWKKNALVLGRSPYQWQHEPCLFGWKKGGKHQWYSDRKQTTIWEYDRPKASKDHPTMKPVALMAYPIQNSCMSNCIVLDPFLGSGSTLIACEETGRICYGIELDENGQPVCILSALPQLEESDPTPAPEENGTDNTNSGTKSDESSGENPASNAKDWSSSLWDDEEDSEKSELGDANAGEESAIPTEKVELDMTAASPEP